MMLKDKGQSSKFNVQRIKGFVQLEKFVVHIIKFKVQFSNIKDKRWTPISLTT